MNTIEPVVVYHVVEGEAYYPPAGIAIRWKAVGLTIGLFNRAMSTNDNDHLNLVREET